LHSKKNQGKDKDLTLSPDEPSPTAELKNFQGRVQPRDQDRRKGRKQKLSISNQVEPPRGGGGLRSKGALIQLIPGTAIAPRGGNDLHRKNKTKKKVSLEAA